MKENLIKEYNNLIKDRHIAMPAVTRSMTKKKREMEKAKSKRIEIDSDESDERDSESEEEEDTYVDNPVYIEIDEANLLERRRLRKKLINTIFSARAVKTALNHKLWPDLQRSDEELKLVIMYIQNNDKIFDENSQEYKAWKEVKSKSPSLYRAAIKGEIKFNEDKLLVIKQKNELNDEFEYVAIAPAILRGKLIHFAHNNPTTQHFGQIPTIDNLTKWFWWPGMREDAKNHTARCPICQAAKGGPSHRHSFATRTLPKPLERLMADFMGPFFKKYYILVLIDYTSGYTVLTPADSCGAIVTSEAIINNWMPYFGWPKEFDCDMGSAFVSKLFKTLLESMVVKHKFAEPRYHNRIGKVERVIGFIQQILRTYNVQFNNQFVTDHDPDLQWSTIESIIPFIQFGINKKRSRISTFSPAMMIMGNQIRDIPDIKFAIRKIKSNLKKDKLKARDYEYLNNLSLRLKRIRDKYKQEWKSYCKMSKRQYDKRYNLASTRDKDGNLVKPKHNFGFQPVKEFIKGAKVLYYAGPQRTGINSKWRQKWTGPWYISKKTGKYSVKIIDNQGKGHDVDIDRLKLFKSFGKDELLDYPKYEQTIAKLKKDKPTYSDED